MTYSDVEKSVSESLGNELTFVRPLPTGKESSQIRPPSAEMVQSVTSKANEIRTGKSPLDSNFQTLLFPQDLEDDSGSMPSVTGLTLGHFIIEERIGRGGMGAVFRAIDQRLDRVVALKILSPSLSTDKDAVQRFQNEARAAARLDHENIARVHYIGEEHGLYFIAFEFVTGTNVRNFILQKGKMSQTEVVNYALQIAEALRHTSAANVVHRDIKPSNIIISPTGRAKLVDLGLARHQKTDGKSDLTVAGTALGTFDYISPEQAIDARNVDVRSDIYSLGCTVYHMITGEPPYPKGTMFQKVVQHHESLVPDVSQKNRTISPQLSRVVKKMMASNPDERYANADALVNDLVQIAENIGLQPTNPDAIVWTTPLYKARNPYWDGTRTWMAVALVLLLCVFLVDHFPEKSQSVVEAPVEPTTVVSSPTPETIPDSALVGAQSKLGQMANDESWDKFPPFAGIAGAGDGTSGANLSAQSTSTVGLDQTDPEEPSNNQSSTRMQESQYSDGSSAETITSRLPVQGPTTPAAGVSNVPASPSSSTEPFLVSVAGDQVIPVSTLSDAFAIAQNNSEIRVQTDGILEIQRDVIRISKKDVRLKAADGVHPLIRFDLRNSLERSPFADRASVFEIGEGGTLTIYGIHLELLVDESTDVDDWSMFTLAPGAKMTARWASFTITNPHLIPAALFTLPEAEPSEISSLMPERVSQQTTLVNIRESILRGQMDGVAQTGLRSVDIRMEETAIHLTGTIHRIDGSESMSMGIDSEDWSAISQLYLNHVTAITGEGILSATCGDHGSLSEMNLDVRNSVFRLEKSGPPLIWLEGHLDTDVLADKLVWQDHSDPNLLVGNNPICLADSTMSFLFEPTDMSQKFVESGITRISESTVLELPASQMETAHLVQPKDFFLKIRSDVTNPAYKAASDGRDLGVDWPRSQMPQSLRDPLDPQLD